MARARPGSRETSTPFRPGAGARVTPGPLPLLAVPYEGVSSWESGRLPDPARETEATGRTWAGRAARGDVTVSRHLTSAPHQQAGPGLRAPDTVNSTRLPLLEVQPWRLL